MKNKGQGSLEYLIIVAGVLAVAAVVVLFITSASNPQAAKIAKCKQAATQCDLTHQTAPMTQCKASCYQACVDSQTGKDVLLSSQAYANSAALPNAADTNSNGRIEPVDAPAATNIGSVFCLYGNANFGA